MKKPRSCFKLYVANHTWQVPTFPLLIHLAFPTPETDLAHDSRMKYVPAGVRKNLGHEPARKPGQPGSRGDFRCEGNSRSFASSSQADARRRRADDGWYRHHRAQCFPGFALHEELYYLVQAGLTPMQALQAATESPPNFWAKPRTQGTIDPGKFADLVLLDANPLDDIRNTQKICAVILRGKLLELPRPLDAIARLNVASLCRFSLKRQRRQSFSQD